MVIIKEIFKDKKTKLILFAIIGIAIAVVLLILQSLGTRKTLDQQTDKLRKENLSLSQKVDETLRNNRRLQENVSSLNKELTQFSKERQDLQARYNSLKKEREELLEKLKDRPAIIKTVIKEVEKIVPKEVVPPDSYWAGVLKEKRGLEVQLETINKELQELRLNNEQLRRGKDNLELEVNRLTRDNQDLKRQLDYSQKIVDGVTGELVVEKNNSLKMQEALKVIKEENAKFIQQLRALNARSINLEARVAGLRTKESPEANVTQEERKEQAETVSGASDEGEAESVELPPIVIRPQQEAEVSGNREEGVAPVGKILAVNKESNFVIINLGADAGLMPGDTFRVYRQGEKIASIQVLQVRREISACDIKQASESIKIGDIIE